MYFAELCGGDGNICRFAGSPAVKRQSAYRVARLCNGKFKRESGFVRFVGRFPLVNGFVGKFQHDGIFAYVYAAVIFDNGISLVCRNGCGLRFAVVNFRIYDGRGYRGFFCRFFGTVAACDNGKRDAGSTDNRQQCLEFSHLLLLFFDNSSTGHLCY